MRPDLWDHGIARRLLEPTMALFERWRTTHRGLFTFSHSPKHHALYQKFGFYPRFLTAVLGKRVSSTVTPGGLRRFSQLDRSEHDQWLADAREVTDTLYSGLDLTHEIRVTDELRLGDTLFLDDEDRIAGFAVCHVDATVVIERPQIAPFRDQMRASLAAALGIGDEHVNVKATRGEGMGFIGRGEGAACLAIATVDK